MLLKTKQNLKIKIKPIFGLGFWFDDWNVEIMLDGFETINE